MKGGIGDGLVGGPAVLAGDDVGRVPGRSVVLGSGGFVDPVVFFCFA
jgi:hypothetical protein